MTILLRRALALLLCLTALVYAPMTALATDASEPSEEEQAQWAEWAAQEDDEAAEGAYSEDNAEALTPEEEAAVAELGAALDEVPVLDEVDLSNLEPNTDLPANVFNILLLGVDNRSTELQRGLSDAVIVCSVNTDTGSVKLTSFCRDTAVVVPGYKSKKRINVAYKYGGPELAMKTVNRNFQMNCERYVVVNIHGLADIIETLGGVELDMTSREAGRINYELRKEPMDKVKRTKVEAKDGVQHLDGMQAVTFARIRGIDSDLERTRRQRQLLEALLEKVMQDMDIQKFSDLVSTALKYGQTNLTSAELLSLGLTVLGGEAMDNLKNGGEVLEQFRLPMDKHFGYKEFGGASLIYLSEKNLKLSIESMQEFVYGQSYYKE